MRKHFTFILFIILSLPVFAQEALYQDNFDKDLNIWKTPSYQPNLVFRNGMLIMKGDSEEDIAITLSDIIIDPAKDFSISSPCTFIGGSEGNAFGMIFSDETRSDDPRHYFFMFIPKIGFEIYYSKTTGRDLRFMEYQSRLAVQGLDLSPGQRVDFELKNTGGNWQYFINGQNVWGRQSPGICITAVGYFTSGFRELSIDELIVKQDGWNNINLPEGSQARYERENLGAGINSSASELLPIIAADGKTLYLCVQGDGRNRGGMSDQDIWYSTLNPDKTWSARKNIGFPLNNTASNFVNYISPDNNTLLLGNRYDEDGELAGEGLSISNRTEKGWSIPEPLEIANYYNRNRFVSVSYSPSGRILIFSIERDDTYGSKDFYVSQKLDGGTWSEPLNMGPDINTYGDEISPFLAADNTTLYFATDSRPGYGGYDIFYSRRLDDSWTKWSEPVNLGPSINTHGGDAYFTIPASGEYSYLVSSKDTYGGTDIFRVKVAESARPKPVALVKGKVVDQETSMPLEAQITYFDLETNEEIGTARSNPNDGTYQIALPAGHSYSFLAELQGYYPVSENIDLTMMDKYTELTRDLYLVPIKVGQTIRLNNIFFEFDKSDLLPASIFELNRLVTIMNANPTMIIRIEGHTDNYGTDEYNQRLSEARAGAVFTFLKSKDLSNRASSRGYGESRPIATNETDEGRAQNRRVEFEVLEM